jgi:parvulin-like peptidyl-prolyl isomerase
VQKQQFEDAAAELDVEVTDGEVAEARKKLLDDRFQGDEKKLADALEEQGLTEDALRETLRFSLLADEIYKAVTKDVKITDAEALASYNQNRDQYGTPESRQVRHILIAEKDSNGQVDFPQSKTKADDVYAQLRGGADFEDLVQQHSDDTGTKAQGGKYLANRGQSVPEFDEAAFKLKTNEISRPVRTQYGYHLIQPLEAATPAKITPFDKVKAGIKATLLQERRTEVATKWAEDLKKNYEDKVSYATGFAPPSIPDPTETETQTETQ